MKRVLIFDKAKLTKTQTMYDQSQNLMWAFARIFSNNYNCDKTIINVDNENKYFGALKNIFSDTEKENVKILRSKNDINITITKGYRAHLSLASFLDLFIMTFRPTEIRTHTKYKIYDVSDKYIYSNLLLCLRTYASLDNMANAIYNMITSDDNVIYRDKYDSDSTAILKHAEKEDIYCSVYKIKRRKNKHE